jgi:hypothetical protein
MAPPKKYASRIDLHINIESDLKEVGDFFGVIPTKALSSGYRYLIEHDIKRFGAPEEVLDKWNKYTNKHQLESNAEYQLAKELKKKAHADASKKKHVDDEQDRYLTWMYESLFPTFTPGELEHFIASAKSSDDYKVRYAITGIIKQYNERKCASIVLSKEDESTLINHLIDFGGV